MIAFGGRAVLWTCCDNLETSTLSVRNARRCSKGVLSLFMRIESICGMPSRDWCVNRSERVL